MPSDSFPFRAKSVLAPVHMNREICRLGEGHNLLPLDNRLNAGKPFPQKP